MFLDGKRQVTIFLTVVVGFVCGSVVAFEAEDYEEAAGLAFGLHANPGKGSWEFGFEDGTWLVGTPVFGNAFLHALRLEKTDAWYGGLGMIFRIMPHWRMAPFVGGGGGYYHPWTSSDGGASDGSKTEPDSFWAGRLECGVRVGLAHGEHFFEITAGYNWIAVESDLDFGSFGLAYGQRW